MLKTNWSHVVAQNPPPHLASHPERFHHSLGSGEFHKANALVGEGVCCQPDLYFRGGKMTWKSIKLEWMAMNGWQLSIRDDLFHPNWLNDGKFLNLCEGSKVYWRTSFWNSSILKSSGCAMGHRSYCASIDPLSHIPSQTVWENFRNPNFHFGGIWTLTTKTWCKLIQPCNYNYHRA